MSDLSIYIITGESSGDALGAPLMRALTDRYDGTVTFAGIGGEEMEKGGMESLFPLSELAIMSPLDIAAQFPRLLGLVRKCVDDIVNSRPDCLVLIDSPEFTHAVAKRVRRRAPEIPIINYAPPSVWAWRPGRAKRMPKYIDRALAILPFEEAVYKRLSGPPCVYVGHPLVARMKEFEPDQLARSGYRENPCLLVLPGSRASEVKRLCSILGEAVALVSETVPNLEVILPVVSHVRSIVEDNIAGWAVKPKIIEGEEAKLTAFGRATAAIAASGTVTLELSLARVPMVAGYRVDWLANGLRWLVVADSVLLPNLITEEKFVPELLQQDFSSEILAEKVIPLLTDDDARQQQFQGFTKVIERMSVPGMDPSTHAANEIIDVISAAHQASRSI